VDSKVHLFLRPHEASVSEREGVTTRCRRRDGWTGHINSALGRTSWSRGASRDLRQCPSLRRTSRKGCPQIHRPRSRHLGIFKIPRWRAGETYPHLCG